MIVVQEFDMDKKTRDEIRDKLIAALGKGKVLWQRADLIPYTKDTFNIKFNEEYEFFPDFVILPQTTSDVQKTVIVAAEHKLPLIPKGGGSNRTGMIVPLTGGIIVDTIGMKRVLEIDEDNLFVTVQPGITLKELEEHLNSHGFALNQEQGSLKVATVGGAISTCGFSRKHNKYGTVADRLMSLEAVLADGRVLRTGPKVLYTDTGYRLHQLFVGAEGTLGIMTEVTLRIEPLPEAQKILLAFYDDFWAAKEVARRLTASGVTFVGAEAYETPKASTWGATEGKKGVFYVIFEGTKGEVEAEVAFVKEIIRETHGIIAPKEASQEFLQEYSMQWCGLRALTNFEDGLTPYIPLQNVKKFYEKLYNEIMPKYGLTPIETDKYSLDIGRYSMAYGRFLYPKTPEGWKNYNAALRDITKLVAELGGSVSCCHGVGIQYRDYMDLEFTEVALDTFRRIKKAFDPDNIMNPGKKINMKSIHR